MAKVEIIGFNGMMCFGKLDIGQYFLYEDELHVKVSESISHNAFLFCDDVVVTFDITDLIIPIASNEITIRVERGRK